VSPSGLQLHGHEALDELLDDQEPDQLLLESLLLELPGGTWLDELLELLDDELDPLLLEDEDELLELDELEELLLGPLLLDV
jgi:hypothetical protein